MKTSFFYIFISFYVLAKLTSITYGLSHMGPSVVSGLLAPSQKLQTGEDFGWLEPAKVPWVRTAARFKQNGCEKEFISQ